MAKAAVVPIFSGASAANSAAEQAEGQGQCFDWVERVLGHDGFSSQCMNGVGAR
jgi:hypothetical protein